MVSMNISLPDFLRDYVQDRIDSGQYASASDYVRDLIRRDQGRIADEQGWLRDLDTSIAGGLTEMRAGGGIDLDTVCDEVTTELRMAGGTSPR